MDFLSRFRGNLVIDGIEPFEEDKFEVIEIGHATFRVFPCTLTFAAKCGHLNCIIIIFFQYLYLN